MGVKISKPHLSQHLLNRSNMHISWYTYGTQLWWGVFELTFRPKFEKSVSNYRNMTLICSRSKAPHMPYTYMRSKYLSVSLCNWPFWVMAKFWKVHRTTPNELFEVNSTHMYTLYIPNAHNCVRFSPLWSVFELSPNFYKSALNAQNFKIAPRNLVYETKDCHILARREVAEASPHYDPHARYHG